MNILEAVMDHAKASVALHMTNVAVYLSNPAGIGEHSDIVEAVQAELDKAAMHQDRWDMANKMLEKEMS